jgi:hypothetical protein
LRPDRHLGELEQRLVETGRNDVVPRSAAASATTSIAAAFSSTRKTSASADSRSRRSDSRSARLREAETTSSRCSWRVGPVLNSAVRRPASGTAGSSRRSNRIARRPSAVAAAVTSSLIVSTRSEISAR